MHPISHGLTGLLMLKICENIQPQFFSKSLFFIVFAVGFSMIPDVDSLWKSMHIRDHHKSFFHAPLFWLAIGLAIIVTEYLLYSNIFGLGFLFILTTQFHLLSDYITAREAGIAWFYPFCKKEYSLVPMNKEVGNFDFLRSTRQQKKAYYEYYFSNLKLLAFEVIIPLASLFIFLA
ncbi:MAG: metal-dependent hydrolase [Candidatus Nanoarchaeia archaeon]